MSTSTTPTSTPGERLDARQYRRLVLVLGILGALGPLTIDSYLPALPHLASNLHATTTQAQLTLSAMMVGMGVGQLVFGPLSDAVGRRRPLLGGLVAHVLASVVCALAPNVWVLLGARLVQGLATASIAVISQAIVRDLFKGMRAAELLSRLALVSGLGPVVAPLVGSGLLTFTSWRGIFVVLGAMAVLIMVLTRSSLAESLPVSRRIPATVAGTVGAYRRVLTDGPYLAVVFVAAMVFTALFAYVSGSSFVLQQVFGLSPQLFGICFASMSLGITLAAQANPRLVRRVGPVWGLVTGLLVMVASSAVMLMLAQFRLGGLAGFLVPMFGVMAGLGIALPNAPAVALHRHGANAGTAAALLGASQFVMGGLVTPLVGTLADGTSRPVPLVVLGASVLALVVMLLMLKRLRAESYD